MTEKALIAVLLWVTTLTASAADWIPVEQAKKNGFRTCLKSVEDLARFVVEDSKHASLGTWNKKMADTRLFNSQVAVKYSDLNSVSILNVAPTKSGKCDSTYTTVATFEKSCAAVRETILSKWKFSGELGGLVVLENDNGGVSVILVPAGPSCTTVKTEVIYE